jgi:cytochrome bd ubiquinol oxidase subunit I
MEFDTVLLSRIQFALTIMFHYLFPPLTIGMGIVLVYLDGMYWRTGKATYERAAKFWTKIFALNFAIGVATGIVMEFEFGTNWAVYSSFVGDVFGSPLAFEAIFAFFLESGFLAVLVFGWDKVSRGFHFLATCMVALGSIFSSIWIVVANSWQQTPQGHHIVPIMKRVIGDNGMPLRDEAGEVVKQPWFVDGVPMMRAEIVDFWQVVFNPSTAHRLTHVLLGCFIMGSFFIMSISAWYLLRRKHEVFARHSFRGALGVATVASLAILVSGHLQAQNVYEHQPAKMAAFEGHFETGPADLSLFGIPNREKQRLDWAVSIPGGLSFLIHDDLTFSEEVMGLDKFAPEDQPPLLIPFVTYHVMVAIGMAFIALTLLACFFLWRGTLWNQRWLLAIFVVAVLPAVVANQFGWIAAEVGRQPWIVYADMERNENGELDLDENGHVQWAMVENPLRGTPPEALPEGVTPGDIGPDYIEAGLRTSDAVSKAVSRNEVLFSICMFGLIYVLLGTVWVVVLNKKIQHGPEPIPEGELDESRSPFFKLAAKRTGHSDSLTREER